MVSKQNKAGKHSAGILVYRQSGTEMEVFLVHPGGPFWEGKDEAAWSIPKGEFDSDAEAARNAAAREFREETGMECPESLAELGTLKTSSKTIHAWMAAGDYDPSAIASNTFEMEFPKGSGKMETYPEIDRGAWFNLDTARGKLHKGQAPLVDMLVDKLRLK